MKHIHHVFVKNFGEKQTKKIQPNIVINLMFEGNKNGKKSFPFKDF